MSRRRGRIFSYLAAFILGLVCHIGDSGVAGNKLRSSCVLDFLAVLVLLVLCANLLFLGPFRIFWRRHPRRGLENADAIDGMIALAPVVNYLVAEISIYSNKHIEPGFSQGATNIRPKNIDML